jgi:hypothetical protein
MKLKTKRKIFITLRLSIIVIFILSIFFLLEKFFPGYGWYRY